MINFKFFSSNRFYFIRISRNIIAKYSLSIIFSISQIIISFTIISKYSTKIMILPSFFWVINNISNSLFSTYFSIYIKKFARTCFNYFRSISNKINNFFYCSSLRIKFSKLFISNIYICYFNKFFLSIFYISVHSFSIVLP